MKIIEEGYRNGTFSAQQIFALAYETRANSRNSCFWIKNFTQSSEESRREIISFLIENHEENVLEDFLTDFVITAQKFGFIRFSQQSQVSDAEVRACLLKEILLWREWGVKSLDRRIYLAAFYLIYYHIGYFVSGNIEDIREIANDDLREEIILKLAQIHGKAPGGKFEHKEFLKNFISEYLFGKLWQSTFADVKDAPLSKQSEVYREHCYNQKLIGVFSGFARWQKWGIDFSFAEENLERFFASFLKRNKIDPQREDYNAEAFVNFIETTGFELSLGLKQKLSQLLSQFPFNDKQKQHMVLQCLAD